jgi:RND family efflux transporter MFP subunit
VNPIYIFTALLMLPLAPNVLAIELPTIKPQKGSIHRWINLPASLAPWQQVALKARVAGYVKSVSVDLGDRVSAGQTLIEMEVPELEAKLISRRAEVTAADIEVKRLHEARKKSPDLILPQAVDDAEAKLAIANAGMEEAMTLLDFAQIKAPFAGVVTSRNVDMGAYAAIGGDALLHIMDTSTLRMRVAVIELETGFLKVGQPVEVRAETLAGSLVKGSISRISGGLDEATRT